MLKKLPITLILTGLTLVAFMPFANANEESECLDWWKIEFTENDHQEMENGYYGVFCDWVPGLTALHSMYLPMPRITTGNTIVAYDPVVMEDQLIGKGYDPNAVRGIALQSCYHAQRGSRVIVHFPDGRQSSPHVAVDCARAEHVYSHVFVSEISVEIDFRTAVEFGFAGYDENGEAWHGSISNVTIEILDTPSEIGEINFFQWWRNMAEYQLDGEFYSLEEIERINPEPGVFTIQSVINPDRSRLD